MRVTREVLLNIAAEAVKRRLKQDSSIVAAYLQGSVKEDDDPLLGGTTDVDLVFIVAGGERRREIGRVTDDITLDIEFHPQKFYKPPRGLRSNPWLGHAIYNCEMLHDPAHFIDFVQASVRGLFDTPENVLGRAEPLLTRARQTWLKYHTEIPSASPALIAEYLEALENIANAVACLTGAPLSERRFLLNFPGRAQQIGSPGLYAGFLGLLGAAGMGGREVEAWLPEWEQAYGALGGMPLVPPHLHPNRKNYHLNAFRAILAGDQPLAAVWSIFRTWTHMVRFLPAEGVYRQKWVNACDQLNLLNSHFEAKADALDVYLDTVEELFERWKAERGV